MELLETRDGLTSARIKGQLLHSKFSPFMEAEKFLQQWIKINSVNENSSIILIEPGLGYLLSLLKESGFNNLIIFFLSTETYCYCKKKGLLKNTSCWSPESNEKIGQFLKKQIGLTQIQDIKILEWTPSMRIFQNLYNTIHSSILDFLKILQANQITTAKFGRRWLKNSIRNYIMLKFNYSFIPVNMSIILAASGFTLENHLNLLCKMQKHIFIVALPSSVQALVKNGIFPDLIITTDPGFYASQHYRTFPDFIPVAAPLSAYPMNFPNPLIGINQLSELDKVLWQDNEYSVAIPEMGTVAATALGILQQITDSDIYILGLDLCMKDIQEHVYPHPFDIFSVKDSGRFKPDIQHKYERIQALAVSRQDGYYYTNSMLTYRNWFNQNNFSNQIIRVDSSPVKLPLQSISSLEGISVSETKGQICMERSVGTSKVERKNRIIQFLEKWICQPEYYNFQVDHFFSSRNKSDWRSEVKQIIKSLELL